MSTPEPGRIERFERRVVLRLSRGLYLFLAAFAALGLVGAGLVLAWTLSPSFRGGDPPVPTPPPPVQVSLEDVLAALDGASAKPAAPAAADAVAMPQEIDTSTDASSQSITLLAERLKALFDATRYPWLSEKKSTCVAPGFDGGCFRYEERVLKKGVVEMVNGALAQRSAGDAQLALLSALVEVVALVEDADALKRDNARFVAVGTVVDVTAVFDDAGERATVVAALRDALAPANPQGARTPVGSDVATDLLGAVIKARKRGADPAVMATWLQAARDLRALFGVDAGGASTKVDGLVACWEALGGTAPVLASQRIEGIKQIAPRAPEPRRPEVVRAYGRLVRDRSRAAEQEYQARLTERDAEIAAADVAVEMKRQAKQALRGSALTALGGALVAVAVLGLFLALLAIERNTRALRGVMERLP